MKVITIKNKNKKKAFNKMLLSMMLAIIFIFLLTSLIIRIISTSEKYEVYKEIKVQEILYNGKKESFQIKDINNEIFYVNAMFETTKNLDKKIQKDDLIEITYSRYKSNNQQIYAIKHNNQLIIDITSEYKFTSYFSLSLSIIILVVSIFFSIFYFIKYLKMPVNIEKDYVVASLENKSSLDLIYFNKESKTIKKQKRRLILIIAFFCCILSYLILLPIIKNEIAKLLIIILLIIFGLFIIFYRNYATHKNISLYIDDYLAFINKEEKDEKINKNIFFLKEGFKITSESDVAYFDYHEMNFYVAAVYKRGNRFFNVFICSDLNDSYQTSDIIIPINNSIYKQIKENNIYIRGFDNFYENINEIVFKEFSTPFKGLKVVKYK